MGTPLRHEHGKHRSLDHLVTTDRRHGPQERPAGPRRRVLRPVLIGRRILGVLFVHGGGNPLEQRSALLLVFLDRREVGVRYVFVVQGLAGDLVGVVRNGDLEAVM